MAADLVYRSAVFEAISKTAGVLVELLLWQVRLAAEIRAACMASQAKQAVGALGYGVSRQQLNSNATAAAAAAMATAAAAASGATGAATADAAATVAAAGATVAATASANAAVVACANMYGTTNYKATDGVHAAASASRL